MWARVTHVGTTSVRFEAEIRDGDRVMARCRTVEVSLDEDDRPRPLVPEHRAAFERRRLAGVRYSTSAPSERSRRSPRCRATRTAVAFMSSAAAVEATSRPTTSMQVTTSTLALGEV